MPIRGKDNPKPWQPGQSGNPAGRPKGSRNRATVMRELLELHESMKNPITGMTENLSQEYIISLAQIAKARKGDTHAYKAVMDSAYGSPLQKQEVTTEDHIVLRFTDAEIPGHTTTSGAAGSSDES